MARLAFSDTIDEDKAEAENQEVDTTEDFPEEETWVEENQPTDEIEEVYNKHYISAREDGVIVSGWSDGPHPKKDTTGAVCINEQGGYQFQLILDGKQTEENPNMYTMDGIPLYKWDGEQIVRRTEEEIAIDRAAIPEPPPSTQEQLRADVDFIAAMTGVSL